MKMAIRKTQGHPVLIIGAGRGGSALLEMFIEDNLVEVVAVVDPNLNAPGMLLAANLGIPVYLDVGEALRACQDFPDCIVYNLTHDDTIAEQVSKVFADKKVTSGLEAKLIWQMITNLNRTKDEFEKSQRQLKALIHNVMDGIITMTELGEIQDFNPAAEKIFGYSRQEVLGQNVKILMPEPIRGEHDEYLSQYRRTGQVHIMGGSGREVIAVRKNGELFPMELSASEVMLGSERYFVGIVRDITERKRAEENLLITQFVSDHAPDCIIWINEQARIVYANETTYRERGYSKNELLTMSISDIDPDFPIDVWPEHWQELQKKGCLIFETRHKRKDGSIFPVEISANFVKFGGEELNVAFIRNITERKQAEEALRYSEERFRDVSEAAGEYLWEIDSNMVYTYVSKRSIEVKGYTPDELLGHTPMEFMHVNDIQSVGEIVNAAIANKAPFKLRHRDVTKSGAVLWEEVNGVPFCDKNGTVIGLRGTGLNITEIINAEAELRIAAVAFESHEIFMITNADGVILKVNRAFTDCTGYTAEEVVGKMPSFLESGRHDADFYRVMWDNLTKTGKWQGEIWDRRKNGEIYPKWLTITAVTTSSGVITHYVASHIDITQRKAEEDDIKKLAFFDPLTSLPNRRLLMDRLQQAIASSARSSRNVALLFIDLDHFKTLNDTLGHDIGDLLLQQVARRLESCVRGCDTVARLGGDEFVLILEDLSGKTVEAAAQMKNIGEKILATLSQQYQLAEHEYHSSPSIGATLFKGHQSTIEELMKQADIAMYQAKKAGRGALSFFDHGMQASLLSISQGISAQLAQNGPAICI